MAPFALKRARLESSVQRGGRLGAPAIDMPAAFIAVEQSQAGISSSTRAHDLAHVEQFFEHLGLRRVVRPTNYSSYRVRRPQPHAIPLLATSLAWSAGYAAFRMAAMPFSQALAAGTFDLRPVFAAALSLSATAAIMILPLLLPS